MVGHHGFGLAQIIVPAAAAILGVLVGGLITFYSQRRERRHDHVSRQLECFYGPLLAMRQQIRSKSELRLNLHKKAHEAWQKRLDSLRHDPQALMAVEKARGPEFDKLFNYSDEQLRDELIPHYRKMLEHFTQYMWLAEPSTLDHFSVLVDFVEIWNRFLAHTLPHEVLELIDHSEKDLYPFYDDLETQTKRLREELGK